MSSLIEKYKAIRDVFYRYNIKKIRIDRYNGSSDEYLIPDSRMYLGLLEDLIKIEPRSIITINDKHANCPTLEESYYMRLCNSDEVDGMKELLQTIDKSIIETHPGALMDICVRGNLDMLKLIIDYNVDANNVLSEYSPFQVAVINDRAEIVDFLIRNKEVDFDLGFKLACACCWNDDSGTYQTIYVFLNYVSWKIIFGRLASKSYTLNSVLNFCKYRK